MTEAAASVNPLPATVRGAFVRARERARQARARRPRIRITREGKVFIGVTVGVGVAAINTGNNLLFLVLGLMLSIITLSGVLSQWALEGLTFTRHLPRNPTAGAACAVELEVANGKRWMPSYSIEIEDRIRARRVDKRCYFLKIAAGARQTAVYRRVPPIRGREVYEGLRVSTRFPFGLIEKYRTLELPAEQWVWPAPLPAWQRPDADVRQGLETPGTRRGRGDVDGLREIREGEPVRDVDWKKSAALERLVARERRNEGLPVVRLRIRNGGTTESVHGPAHAQAEREIRRAAFVLIEALRRGAAVELTADDAGHGRARQVGWRPGGATLESAMGFLARLPPDNAGYEEPARKEAR